MAKLDIRVTELPDRSAAIVSICGFELTFHSTREALQWVAALAKHHKLTLTAIRGLRGRSRDHEDCCDRS